MALSTLPCQLCAAPGCEGQCAFPPHPPVPLSDDDYAHVMTLVRRLGQSDAALYDICGGWSLNDAALVAVACATQRLFIPDEQWKALMWEYVDALMLWRDDL